VDEVVAYDAAAAGLVPSVDPNTQQRFYCLSLRILSRIGHAVVALLQIMEGQAQFLDSNARSSRFMLDPEYEFPTDLCFALTCLQRDPWVSACPPNASAISALAQSMSHETGPITAPGYTLGKRQALLIHVDLDPEEEEKERLKYVATIVKSRSRIEWSHTCSSEDPETRGLGSALLRANGC
jgi:hypothetical protein